jgi:HSP20 family protein
MAEVAVTKAPEMTPFPKRLNWGFPFTAPGTLLSPLTMMRDFSREMDRMFNTSFGPGAETGTWWPAVECKKTNGTLLVTAELPGLKKEDVKVEVTDNALVIEGERKFETKKEEEGYFQTERSYGKFVRSIPLPEGCKPEEIKAELANGVLEVKVPVAETKHTMRRVPIDEKKKG